MKTVELRAMLGDELGGDPGSGIRLDPADRQPAVGGDSLDDVAVGGEVVPVEHDLGASRIRIKGGPHELVEQHRRGVADDGLTCGRADHRPADGVSDLERKTHP